MKILKFIMLLLLGTEGKCQSVVLNALDSAGKKHGKWVLYLDEDWHIANDSANAKFCRYTYFDHGVNLYPMGACGGKGFILVSSKDSSTSSGQLHGKYVWYDSHSRLKSEHFFDRGEYVYCKEFYPNGTLQQYFNYKKVNVDSEISWTVTGYKKSGEQKFQFVFCKDKNGRWPKMR